MKLKLTAFCRPVLALLLLVCFIAGKAQVLATLTVDVPKYAAGLDIPVSVNLDDITFLPDSVCALTEIQNGKKIPVPIQIDSDGRRTLSWIIRRANANQRKVYQLSRGVADLSPEIVAVTDGKSLTMQAGEKKLLNYRYATTYPPVGVDSAYQRSGFIHPLWSPRGQELTRIQPPDHYHHYGIWNPWTHVLYKGDTIDFWNIKGRKGTVRFARFISKTSGHVFSEMQALHEHVVMLLKNKVVDEVALNELHSIRVYNPEKDGGYYIVDLTFQLNCASENAFNILEYRYAGLGWRTTQQWDRKNSEFLSSEGKTRKDADGTKARWFIIQGAVDGDFAGAVVMSHPSNYNHPEPMRIWPENQYDRGDVFVSFAPTKDKDWLLRPGRKYTQRYRVVVFNDRFSKEKAESAWQSFATAPVVTIKKN